MVGKTGLPERQAIPGWLSTGSALVGRLLVLSLAAYLFVVLLSRLTLIVLPLLAAVLFAALLAPVDNALRRMRLPRAVAALLSVSVALAVLGGVGYLVVIRAVDSYPALVDQAGSVVNRISDLARRLPGVNGSSTVTSLQTQALDYLATHRNALASQTVTGLRLVAEVLTAVVATIFFTAFFLYDGQQMWGWFVDLLPRERRAVVSEAGDEAWRRVSGFVRGTFLIAVFHGIVIGFTLELLGTPLAVPLGLLVFVGSFIPIVGAVVFGGLAVLVTLVTNGLIPGAIILVVLVVENQAEAHLLQPFLVGRYVHLHPVAVAVSIGGGGLLAGLAGAIVAVPLVAASYGAVQVFARARPTELIAAPVSAERPAALP